MCLITKLFSSNGLLNLRERMSNTILARVYHLSYFFAAKIDFIKIYVLYWCVRYIVHSRYLREEYFSYNNFNAIHIYIAYFIFFYLMHILLKEKLLIFAIKLFRWESTKGEQSGKTIIFYESSLLYQMKYIF